MAFDYLIRGQEVNCGSLLGKEQVFFTCHPGDMSYLRKIANDIFASQDVAIIYDSTCAQAEEQDIDLLLGEVSLFVLPVTAEFIAEESAARDYYLPFAKSRGIPILLILCETGFEKEVNRVCGNLQCLNASVYDNTAIPYEEKLRGYLNAVFIGDELKSKIRAHFDACIFLSYRKKDRRHARELMSRIHAHEVCRDCAIWYDEFLVPGEDFNDSIRSVMEQSRLFVMAVTPNLLEYPNGQPNYVIEHEYTAAQALRQDGRLEILPIEMVKTDRAGLAREYAQLPDVIDGADATAVEQALLTAVKAQGIDYLQRDNDPEHLYCIGVAYLCGIDVEVDRARALTLLTRAADLGHLAAQKTMVDIHRYGMGVAQDMKQAVTMMERVVKTVTAQCGEEHPETIEIRQRLMCLYAEAEEDFRAAALGEELAGQAMRVLGPKNERTLRIMSDLIAVYGNTGQPQRAIEYGEELLALCLDLYGEEHMTTLTVIHNLCANYFSAGMTEQSYSMCEREVEILTKVYGANHRRTLGAMMVLSAKCATMGRWTNDFELLDRSIRIKKEIMERQIQVYGREHREAQTAMFHYAASCAEFISVSALMTEEALTVARELIALDPENTAYKNLLAYLMFFAD